MYFCDLTNIICQNFLSVSTLVIIDFFLDHHTRPFENYFSFFGFIHLLQSYEHFGPFLEKEME